MPNIGTPELLIILVLVLLVFGGAKLPKLARSLGQAQREFKDGLTESAKEADASGGSQASGGENSGGGASGKNGSS
ncbi:MAG: twin-arginine translocase TatA/TatE family subunit [Acidimicrobiaceae bacterium]|nr:twin-arginine translocase TatA/TatE family subunit [Acidimicrobiaceae bacterium]MYE95981.1 twin-arginine translocase TatA/TatE family subunit [Acidimicrobiaceae bacterium]MYH77229.1 twin-arginine translocase TatA/TatE family subunit [Acidimicrobiaceae bacterium]MYI52605.1 twin-arginine translocase TatA/TatE family subunit [Acidimicrobiaceae bacterium]MYJ81234.1 twin-arginine translocase TatA/TatE family subunit [Acidimicrobiaceae bacterium]